MPHASTVQFFMIVGIALVFTVLALFAFYLDERSARRRQAAT